jgi:hypothetical protein
MSKATGFRLDEDILPNLKKIAKEQERSVNWLVNNTLKNFIEENKIINTDKSSLEPRTPLLLKADVISRFGECKYSCQLTHEPSWFHTILIKGFRIYIEEWMDEKYLEICSTVFTDGKKIANGFANTNLILLLNDIEDFVKNGL